MRRFAILVLIVGTFVGSCSIVKTGSSIIKAQQTAVAKATAEFTEAK